MSRQVCPECGGQKLVESAPCKECGRSGWVDYDPELFEVTPAMSNHVRVLGWEPTPLTTFMVGTLIAEFKQTPNVRYRYSGVPRSVWLHIKERVFNRGESPGGILTHEVRPTYPCEKVAKTADSPKASPWKTLSEWVDVKGTTSPGRKNG